MVHKNIYALNCQETAEGIFIHGTLPQAEIQQTIVYPGSIQLMGTKDEAPFEANIPLRKYIDAEETLVITSGKTICIAAPWRKDT